MVQINQVKAERLKMLNNEKEIRIYRSGIVMKISGIYKIESSIKDKRVYVGSSINLQRRWRDHLKLLRNNKHHSIKLQRHYNKYGESDLQFVVLEVCIYEFLLIREQYYIDLYNPYFNILKIAGSQLGFKHSKKSKEKQRLAKIGKPLSKEHVDNIKKAKGKMLDDVKQKISKGLIGKNTWSKGCKCSKEHNDKISKSLIGNNRRWGNIKSDDDGKKV